MVLFNKIAIILKSYNIFNLNFEFPHILTQILKDLKVENQKAFSLYIILINIVII